MLRDGCTFEQLMMLQHQGLGDYDFLFDLDSADHAYYRWRLFSLAGEGAFCWCVCGGRGAWEGPAGPVGGWGGGGRVPCA